jgi:EH domain-containing protein 1
VYIGSFNSDAPINAAKNPHCVELFKAEQSDLLSDLYEIPSRSCDRKVRPCSSSTLALSSVLLLFHVKRRKCMCVRLAKWLQGCRAAAN